MEKWYNHYVRTIAFFVEMADPFRYFTSSRFLQGSKKSRCAMFTNKRTIDKGIIPMRKSVRTNENIFNNRNKRSCFPCFLFFFAAICFLNTNSVLAQTYPATLKVPVTFYDFHSNGSNPEFECPNDNKRHLGMVDSNQLTAAMKPMLGLHPFMDCEIAKWYVPWTAGDFTIPNYTNPVTTTCSNPFITVNYDTAFKNIVIDTFLIFQYVPASVGKYQYINDAFFPLDGRGFGAEGKKDAAGNLHNFSFTMELHWQFTKAPGMVFNFAGDDDVWAFINGKMAMDIGGIHTKIADSIFVDSIKTLSNGQQYWFDFFFAERHTVESHIEITTNIITAKPDSFHMHVQPDTNVIAAGDSIVFLARIYDQSGNPAPQFNKSIQWTLWTLPGPVLNTTASYLRFPNDSINTFKAIDAYKTYIIKASLDTVVSGIRDTLRWYDTVYVTPGPATKLFIEASPDSSGHLNDSARLGTLTLSSTTSLDSVYAVLRDQFNNWVSHATLASWLSRNPAS